MVDYGLIGRELLTNELNCQNCSFCFVNAELKCFFCNCIASTDDYDDIVMYLNF